MRETRTTLKPLAASWMAYSLPMPSLAPVMTAQVPFLPNLESCRQAWMLKGQGMMCRAWGTH